MKGVKRDFESHFFFSQYISWSVPSEYSTLFLELSSVSASHCLAHHLLLKGSSELAKLKLKWLSQRSPIPHGDTPIVAFGRWQEWNEIHSPINLPNFSDSKHLYWRLSWIVSFESIVSRWHWFLPMGVTLLLHVWFTPWTYPFITFTASSETAHFYFLATLIIFAIERRQAGYSKTQEDSDLPLTPSNIWVNDKWL